MRIYSWDVVYACSGAYINSELAESKDEYIKSFSYEDSAIKVEGEFAAWKLVPGGSEGILQFETPITSGTVVVKEHDVNLSLDGVIPLIQMQLEFIDSKSHKGSKDLVFNCKVLGKGIHDDTPGAVSVINPDTSGILQKEKDGEIAAALLVTGLAKCLIANEKQLSFMFAQLLPVPTKQASWLTPVEQRYVYQQPTDGSLGGIAILGLLDEREIGHLPKNYDSHLLSHGDDFGFILSAEMFMKNIILPSLPNAYGGNATASCFRVDSNKIVTTRRFDLDRVKVGLIHYTPEVKSASFEITDTSMRCYTDTKTDITGLTDANVTNTVTSNNQSRFDVKKRTLRFLKDPHESSTKDEHIPWWEKILGGLTLGIMNAVIAAISLAIQDAVGSLVNSKTAETLGNVAPGLVSWHGQKNMTVTVGGLEDNVYMAGKLNTK